MDNDYLYAWLTDRNLEAILKRLALFILLLFTQARAADWYLAPGAAGIGTLASPGSEATAMAHTGWAASIAAGDTVYYRAGTYNYGTNIMDMQFSGSAGNLVTWRNYPNERAIINHPIYFQSRDYHRFRGLEFYDSNKAMRPIAVGYFDSTGSAKNNEWINCIIHDTPGVWTGYSGGNAIRGCIIWNVGVATVDHVVYPYTLDFSGNIVGYCAGNGIEQGATNMVARSNIMFGTGVTIGTAATTILFTLGGSVVSDNRIFETVLNQYGVHMQTGTVFVTNNIIAASRPLKLNTGPATVTGNTLFANSANQQTIFDRVYSVGTWTVDTNAYYSGFGFVRFMGNDVVQTFAEWKTANPTYDAASTATVGNPADSVTVIPNADDPKRAHIAIYNYSGAHNVTVNLSGVLASGDWYRLYSAQNYLAGPIRTGTYDGTAISLPMTNLTVAPILYVTGLTQPGLTSPTFGAFVVIGARRTLNVNELTVGGGQ